MFNVSLANVSEPIVDFFYLIVANKSYRVSLLN